MRFCLEMVLRVSVLSTAVLGTLAAASLTPAVASGPGVHPVWMVKVDARSGKLVRTLVAPPKAPGADAEVQNLVQEAAKNFDVNPLLVDSVIQVESNYNPYAVSPKGAQGLMQLMPSTAQRFGVTDTFDPRQNIEAGVRYLKFLQDTFQDDRLAIAAYNAGEKAVAKYKDVPPYPETVGYVSKVGSKYGRAKRSAEASRAQEAKAASETSSASDEPRHILAYVDTEGKLHIATK